MNPSLLGFQPIASLSGTYNWLNASQVPEGADNRLFNISVIDGKNQYVNAGLSFTRRSDLDLIHLALAKRVLPWFSLGSSVKRFSTRSNTAAANGDQASGFDGGASMSFVTPKEASSIPIQVGFTADNLRHKAADEVHVGPREIGGGVKATFNEILMVYGDFVESYSNFRGAYPLMSGGLEVALGGDFFARGGLFGNREKGWSAGAGWVGPKLGISYGYQNRRVDAERSFDHAVTVDIYM